MGITTLPNGLEYFSLSEELENFTKLAYQIFTPFNIGIILVATMLFIGILFFLTLYMVRKQLEAVG